MRFLVILLAQSFSVFASSLAQWENGHSNSRHHTRQNNIERKKETASSCVFVLEEGNLSQKLPIML